MEHLTGFLLSTRSIGHGLFDADDFMALRALAEAMTGAIHFVYWSKPTRIGQFWFFHYPSFPQAERLGYHCGFQNPQCSQQDAEGRLQRLRTEVLASRLYQSPKSRKTVNADGGLRQSYGKLFGSMARELVFLENSTFAAWGCRECSWIIPNAAPELSDKPPASVQGSLQPTRMREIPSTITQKTGKLRIGFAYVPMQLPKAKVAANRCRVFR